MRKELSVLFFCIFPLILNAQWDQTNLNPGAGYCLFSDDGYIYAGTESGVYYTDDIGDPWFSIGPGDLIFSVITAGDTIIAGSGTGKGVWISSDLGENWTRATGIDSMSVFSLAKIGNNIFAGSWAGGVFRSDNNGNSWQKVGLDGEPVESVFAFGNKIFASGMGNLGARVYFSSTNGNSWEYCDLPYPTSRIHCFASKGGRLFAGTDGGLYSSNDTGETWSLVYGVTFDSYGNITDAKMFKELMVYDQYLVAAIMFNSIWISADDGKEWISFNEGLISDWTFDGLAIKDSYLWSLTTFFGNAYRRQVSDLVTGIEQEGIVIPDKSILHQNYPNPFNPITNIEFQISTSEYVTLHIFNVLGQKVITLVSEKLNPGDYTFSWDAGHQASGIYYYEVTAGEFRDVKKMILLR